VTKNLRLGIGTPTILDALAQVHADGKAARPMLERGYNICCDLGKVAATLVSGGLAAVEQLRVQPGNPVLVRPTNHQGAHFAVAGPLNVPRSPQGRPLLVQAGSSGVPVAVPVGR
jgi:hypothetical protein